MTIYQKVYKEVYGDVSIQHVFDGISKKYILDKDKVIYDIGCGYGRLFEKLIAISKHCYAVDVDDEAIDVFKSLYPSFKIEKEIDMSWPSPDFVLFHFHVLNYMSQEDIRACFKKLFHSKTAKPIILYANFLNFEKLSGPRIWKDHPVLLQGKKYLLRNSMKRINEKGTIMFVEEIWHADALLIKKEAKLYNWNTERLIDFAKDSNFRVKKVSNVDHSYKTKELILELN
ncbi:class I SAM-dependent methyltransferase [Amylibacter sp.]|nr:class I SAM-dependent methyltransferase [Amylibacter sp.]MDC3304284.1 class I SAM-dependent methyltransferase [Amylibacter sp.]